MFNNFVRAEAKSDWITVYTRNIFGFMDSELITENELNERYPGRTYTTNRYTLKEIFNDILDNVGRLPGAIYDK